MSAWEDTAPIGAGLSAAPIGVKSEIADDGEITSMLAPRWLKRRVSVVQADGMIVVQLDVYLEDAGMRHHWELVRLAPTEAVLLGPLLTAAGHRSLDGQEG